MHLSLPLPFLWKNQTRHMILCESVMLVSNLVIYVSLVFQI